MLIKKFYKDVLVIFACWVIMLPAFSQCISPSPTLPYIEDFETNEGSWITGGNLSDWAWGIPAKPVIRNAGSGNKCWITGGLTGNSYTSEEASWLQSPCFNFSLLQYPHISFEVFWETEKKFDGANLQYSIDQGNTWANVGALSDPNNCLNANWFNSGSITYLSPVSAVKEGWSGNVQNTVGNCQGGDGSGGWVKAQKAILFLAGQPSVTFRFTFGAGTVCNNFDGFAIDKITIGEAPPNNAGFSYTCLPDSTVSFLNTSSLCPQQYLWNFGDPQSGNNNISAIENPLHTFSGPGIYNVTLTVSGPGNAPSSITQSVSVISVRPYVITPIDCFGNDNGSVGVTVTGPPGPFTYSWNTSPPQTTPVASNLPAGIYSVNVSSAGTCPVSASIQLSQPAPLAHTLVITQPSCNNPTGSISISESGGTPPYSYSWSPMASTGPGAVGLAEGQYIIIVTDSLKCTETITGNIRAFISPAVSITAHTDVSCKGGFNGTATATNIGGASSGITYSWNTDPEQLTATATALKAGTYTVTMKDSNGCIATDSVEIIEPLSVISTEVQITNSSCGLANGNIFLIPSGGVPPYKYTWATSSSATANSGYLAAGFHQVTITDSIGCMLVLLNPAILNEGDPAVPFLGRDTTICANQSLVLTPGIFSTYLWQDNSIAPTFTVNKTGYYSVSVMNSSGCIGQDSILVTLQPDCGDVFFPKSFTPNSDNRNDMFGVVGNTALISNYKLAIYNRYGELIFNTTNPLIRWDGTYKNKKAVATTYVWHATYTFRGVGQRSQSGTVTVLR